MIYITDHGFTALGRGFGEAGEIIDNITNR